MQPPGPLAVLTRVLANPSLRRVLASYLAFHIAEFSTWVAILLYAYDKTGPASVGVIALVQLVPAAFVAAPAATLGDRFPRARVLTAGYLFQAVAMLVTSAAMIAELPVVVVYLAAAVAATSLVVTRPTQSALLPSLSQTPDELTAANGAAGVVEGVGVLVGPLIAAAVLVGSSVSVVFAIAGVALIVAALFTFRLRPVISGPAAIVPTDADSQPTGGLAPGVDADVADASFLAGLRTVTRDADARLVVGLLTARMLIVGSADVLFVLMALDLLGTGEPGAGILNAALGGGTILGGALAFGLVGRSGLAMVAVAGSAAWGLTIALAGLTGIAVLAPGLIVIGGAGLTVVDVAGRTILQRSIRDDVLARVFGIQESLAMAALAVGSVLVSVLVSAVGLITTIIVIAAILPAVVLVAWSRLADLDHRAAVPIRALALLRSTRLFAPLPPPQLEAIARRGIWLSVPSGTVLIREGDPGDRYYVLASGVVRVEQGGRHVRDLDRAGEGFGEIALLRDVPRTATVISASEVAVFAVDRAPFLAAVTGHPVAHATAQRVVTRFGGPPDADESGR
ncbi:MAG: cyclic nucleotide-binding domain-containing protein [Chloroflexota bacterium]